jgi:hypothetical protein
MGETKQLLRKIEILNYKYQSVRKQEGFNIFSILRQEHDEVHLHSRFLFELLNPNGSHGFGASFLNLFMDTMQASSSTTARAISSFNNKGSKVYREYRNIDILIRNKSQAIVIENKIWAADQWAQLERYYQVLSSEGVTDIWLLYLTLDGRAPSEESIGTLAGSTDLYEALITISYSIEITEWLSCCIREAALHPTVRETLKQYQNLINKLIGRTMNEEQKKEVLELVAENDNIISAYKIVENWGHIKLNAESNFWMELENEITISGYKVSEREKYTLEKIESAVLKARNRNRSYGVMFRLFSFEGEDICCYIKRGKADWGDLYYGITAERKPINKERKFDSVADTITAFCDENTRNDYWLGNKYSNNRINFWTFDDNNTLMLVNKEFRRRFILDLWEEIRNFLINCGFDNTLALEGSLSAKAGA